MRQETVSESKLTSAQRRRVLVAIAGAVRTFRYPMPPTLPRYPDAIPDLDNHVDHLVRIVRESKPEAREMEIVKRSCPACPHQYPSRYCPLRARGGCVLYRCADSIAQAVAVALDDLDRNGSVH